MLNFLEGVASLLEIRLGFYEIAAAVGNAAKGPLRQSGTKSVLNSPGEVERLLGEVERLIELLIYTIGFAKVGLKLALWCSVQTQQLLWFHQGVLYM
jgi:hypothetical protein